MFGRSTHRDTLAIVETVIQRLDQLDPSLPELYCKNDLQDILSYLENERKGLLLKIASEKASRRSSRRSPAGEA